MTPKMTTEMPSKNASKTTPDISTMSGQRTNVMCPDSLQNGPQNGHRMASKMVPKMTQHDPPILRHASPMRSSIQAEMRDPLQRCCNRAQLKLTRLSPEELKKYLQKLPPK